jgi:phosphotransferase family enzyme
MRATNDGFVLPSVTIAQNQRVAEAVNVQVWKQLGISAYSLFTLDCPQLPLCQVMESRNRGECAPNSGRWVEAASSSERDLFRPGDCSFVLAAIRDMRRSPGNETVGPFAKPGWIEKLLNWAQNEVAPLGLRVTREFCQLNASPCFALVRIETDGPALWFKAVGEPNLREFSISPTLARLFPTFLPTLIATHPSWHGWLAMDFQGSTLDATSDATAWERAAATLAELQIASLGTIDKLRDAGCKDLTFSSLQKRVDPFLEVMTLLMEKQEKITPRALGIEELLTLQARVNDALSAFAQLGLPDVLGHLDINPGNILCSAERCVFVDWAEAYVGPPFLALEHIGEHFLRIQSGQQGFKTGPGSRYAVEWGRLLSQETIAAAQQLAPLVAVLAYAVGIEQWTNPELVKNSRLAAYFRSLTRRLHREAQVLKTNLTRPTRAFGG